MIERKVANRRFIEKKKPKNTFDHLPKTREMRHSPKVKSIASRKVSIRSKTSCDGKFRPSSKIPVWWTISTICPKTLCGGHFGRKNTFDHLPWLFDFLKFSSKSEKAVSLIGLFPLLLCRACQIKLEGDYRGWKKTSFFQEFGSHWAQFRGYKKHCSFIRFGNPCKIIDFIWKSVDFE